MFQALNGSQWNPRAAFPKGRVLDERAGLWLCRRGVTGAGGAANGWDATLDAGTQMGSRMGTHLSQATIERPNEVIDVATTNVHGWRDPNDVAFQTASPDQNAIFAGRLHQP